MGLFRLLLALLVVVAHVQTGGWSLSIGPTLAVKAFFVLSGFYMALTLTSGRYPSAWRFYASRAWRLLPVHLVVLLALVLVAISVPGWNQSGYIQAGTWLWLWEQPDLWWIALPLLASNLFLIGSDALNLLCIQPDRTQPLLYWISQDSACPTGSPLWVFTVNQPMWTLGIEVTFYLLAPVIVRRSWLVLLILTVLAAGVRVWLNLSGLDHHPFDRVIAPAELIYFLLGIWGYRAYAHLERQPNGATVLGVLAGVGIGSMLLARGDQHWMIVLTVALAAPGLFWLTRTHAGDRALGDLAYPVYAGQYLVLGLLHAHLWPSVQGTLMQGYPWVALNCLLVVLLAVVLDRTIQRPSDALRRSWIAQRRTPIHQAVAST